MDFGGRICHPSVAMQRESSSKRPPCLSPEMISFPAQEKWQRRKAGADLTIEHMVLSVE
jgi:hypothetical protein